MKTKPTRKELLAALQGVEDTIIDQDVLFDPKWPEEHERINKANAALALVDVTLQREREG